ncbi:MAG: Major facilitator superfamily protein 10 Tetracycline transporter-like protein [Bacteroidetes bacterium]|nr:Major facilitator superfamily protein 10 Tetracycline transporter-like protein [Bacteroidota bacterium]
MQQKTGRNPILSIFITVFIDMLGVGIIIPIFAPLIVQNDLGIVPAHFSKEDRQIIYGFLTATFSLFQFFGAPILGALADRYGRKRVLNFTLVGTFVGYVFFAGAVHIKILALLFIARAIPGFMGGNISIALAALSDLSDDKSKAKNFGLVGMAFGLGFILGPAIGGALSKYDYSYPLIFTAFLTFINIILVYVQFPETFKPKVVRPISLIAGFQNIAKAFSYKEMRVILLVLFLMNFGFTFFTQFFPVFMIDKFNVSKEAIGYIFGFVGIWMVVTQGFIVRKLAPLFSPPQILRFSIVALGVAVLLNLAPSTLLGLYAVQPLLAIAQGLTQPNITSIISSLGTTENQGEILGIQASVQSLAFSIPPIIAGFICNLDFRYPIMAGSLCLLLSGLIFIFVFTPRMHIVKESVN